MTLILIRAFLLASKKPLQDAHTVSIAGRFQYAKFHEFLSYKEEPTRILRWPQPHDAGKMTGSEHAVGGP
jgi:hypothetical protein